MTIFDRIIAGQIPASFVWQDMVCVAFMDIRPISRGHVLVVPRQSVATLEELEASTLAHSAGRWAAPRSTFWSTTGARRARACRTSTCT